MQAEPGSRATGHGCTTVGGKLEGVQRGAATGYSSSESVRQLFQQQPLAVRRRTAPPQRQIACQDLGTRRVVNILCRPSRPAQYAASLNRAKSILFYSGRFYRLKLPSFPVSHHYLCVPEINHEHRLLLCFNSRLIYNMHLTSLWKYG